MTPTSDPTSQEQIPKRRMISKVDSSLFDKYADALPTVEFKKISYDGILGDQVNAYLQ